ncbi:hypothetical protein ACOME3_008792 [Neoechinorhynchus agilis]
MQVEEGQDVKKMGSVFSTSSDSEQPISELRARRPGQKEQQPLDRISKSISTGQIKQETEDETQSLNLMEQVLLLGLKDKEGYTSFWNDDISTGLRGAMLVELALRKRIRLEACGLRRRPLLTRRLICIDSTPLGDAILDEALRNINTCPKSHSVPTWISLLSGDTWNPFNYNLRITTVRELDKGICGTSKQNFLVFDMTTHPIVANNDEKSKLVENLQASVLSRWNPTIRKIGVRSLALIFLAHSSDVLDNAFNTLSSQDFDLAGKRVRQLLTVDPEQQINALYDGNLGINNSLGEEDNKNDDREKNNVQPPVSSLEVLWAVVAALNK